MKFSVDKDLCVGCEACNGIAPEVFEFPDGYSEVKMDPVTEEFQASALKAEENCPAQAISHQD
ncbi:ferredoxin [Pontiellaceae bacterium B12227]|nr:ferredoxin [Pontiellaceae bacterium B12227]